MTYQVDQLEPADAKKPPRLTAQPLSRKTEPPRISRGVIITCMATTCTTQVCMTARESDLRSWGESGLSQAAMTPPAMISSRLRVHESWNRQVDQSCLFRNNRLKCRRNDVDTSEEAGTAAATARDTGRLNVDNCEHGGNDNREVAPISISHCQTEERETPAGHTRIPKKATTYQEETDKKQRTGIPDERFPVLGSVPSGSLSCLLVSSHTLRHKSSWPLLKPGERLASTHASPSPHGVWPSGP